MAISGTGMGIAFVSGLARKVRAAVLIFMPTVLLVPSVVAPASGASEPEVGTAILIKKKVTGKLGADERLLETGFRVFRNELLRTGTEAQAELKLDDNTKLALGADAELLLDEYAVSAGNDTKAITLKVLKGTLRFLTGSTAK